MGGDLESWVRLEEGGVDDDTSRSFACVGDASSSTGLDIQSRSRRFRRPGPGVDITLSSSSNFCKSEAAADSSTDVSSNATPSQPRSESEKNGVGIISTKVSGKDTRFMGWNNRFGGRFDRFVVCLLGSGLLRRMLRAPRATVYGAVLAKGEVGPEEAVDIDEED